MEHEREELAAHLQTGQEGEDLAVAYLRAKGWEIVTKNYIEDCGEIDIIARQMLTAEQALLAFVEVKSRRQSEQAPPELSVTAKKRRTITRVARNYVDRFGGQNEGYRFDVISVDLGAHPPKIRHFEGAFDARGNPY